MDNNRSINQCTITLTRSCNLRCDFCYAQNTLYRRKDVLSFDDFKSIVDSCDEANIKYIVLTGGEPTLYPKILDALKYIQSKKHEMFSAMATNGIKLQNNDFCHALVESGLKYVDISLKGKDGKNCADTTGCNCFAQQMRAINNISKTGVDFTCSIVLTKHSIGYFCDIVKEACQNGARSISFTFEIDNSASDLKDEMYLREHNPLALIETFISRLDCLNSIVKDWWIEYSLPLCAYTDNQLSILVGKLARPCQIHVGNGITFDTNMNAIPCNMYFETMLGKLGKDFSSITSFRHDIECSPPYGDKLAKIESLPSPNCDKCKNFEQCLGGCPVTWRNYSYSSLMRFKAEYYGQKASFSNTR